jgi:hypothetical protein
MQCHHHNKQRHQKLRAMALKDRPLKRPHFCCFGRYGALKIKTMVLFWFGVLNK